MKSKKQLIKKSNTVSPWLVGVATGLYPVIFYYSNNYTLINSIKHLFFFISLFLIVPSIAFVILQKAIFKWSLVKWKEMIYTFLNVIAFLMFIQLCLYTNIQWLFTLLIFLIAGVIAWFLCKYLKKIVIFQILLAVIGLFSLIPNIISQLNYSDSWKEQPDDIETAIFKNRPNVYYIQPDGYVNFSELERGYYMLKSNPLKEYLNKNQFTLYPDFRSNYTSTLASNMATFTMKHHYNNYGFNFSELPDAREIIVKDNPVLRIFKNNNYKTHFIAEYSYLVANKPEIGYDRCNFNTANISYINDGFKEKQDILIPLKLYMDEDVNQTKFFFIEIFKPGHVPSDKDKADTIEKEKSNWIKDLELANSKIKEIVDLIINKDPNALILIMSDHGGYVGLTHMLETRTKTEDRDKLYSAFSANLAIRWPNNKVTTYDKELKSSINVFRTLFSYLSENKNYLKYLEENNSYAVIEYGAPKGVYKVINDIGDITFEKR